MGFGSSKNNSTQQSQSTSTSSSSNQAYPSLLTSLSPTIAAGGAATNTIKALLSGDSSGLDSYLNSTNYNFTRDQGIEGITNNAAAKGLLGSGATLKGITNYSTNIAQTYLDKYLSALTGQQSAGGSAASILAGAGNVSNSSSTSTSSGNSSGKSTNFTTG